MPEPASYPHGTPSWVDLATSDFEVSASFFSKLFGWEVLDLGPDSGGYALFTKDGKNVAGIGPANTDSAPASWTTYISVDDCDEIAASATEAGGSLTVEPMDVSDVGRMTIFSDDQGAVLAAWEAGTHKSADLTNETGAFCWNELQTRDIERSKAFYESVFGWGSETSELEGMTYTEWKLGSATVGGMLELPARMSGSTTPFWLVYFGVDDTDATVKKAAELGAKLFVDPTDIEAGRFAVLGAPLGAGFGIISL